MSFYSLHKGSTTYNETNCKIVVMVTLHIASIDWGRFQDGNSVRPSPTENKAWCKPNLNHSSIQVVPGQMVPEQIGQGNGIFLSFPS